MGADENSFLKKCGEILINIKSKSRKTKLYTFNCAFCNEDLDQLKKFSYHLDEKHFHEFTEETEETKENSLMLEPEIKLEEHLKQENKDNLNDLLAESKQMDIYEDPLDYFESMETSENYVESIHVKVEVEQEVTLNSDNDERDYEDYVEDQDEDFKEVKTINRKVTKPPRRPKKKIIEASDVSTDDSRDSDFDIEKELNRSKKILKTKSSPKLKKDKKSDKKSNKKPEPELEPETFTESEKQLIIALFEAYEKQSYLWDKNEKKRIFDKSVFSKGYEIIAQQVNEKLNTNITADMAKDRITTLFFRYSYELEQKREGLLHELPWYSVNMQFLQKNLNTAIRGRFQKKLKRLTATMDESKLHIYIEMYKKNEDLWNVKNLAFGVPAKRNDCLKNIHEDLKANHAIDIDNATLNEYIKYINNIYSQDRKLQLKCELENTEFIAKSKFYKDLGFLGDSQGPFRCPYCNEFIQRYDNYHVHVSNHTSIIPFKCPLCEMGFKRFDKLIIHAKRHLGIHNYHCNICGKGYPFKGEYDFHMTSHTGDKPYLCQICGAAFKALNLYNTHVRRHDDRFRHQCHICNQGFYHLHALKDHVASHLNIRDHICNTCGKSFTAAKYLIYHKRIHDNAKRYKCEQCGKLFAQSAGLRQHRRHHKPRLSAAEIKRKYKELSDDQMINFVVS